MLFAMYCYNASKVYVSVVRLLRFCVMKLESEKGGKHEFATCFSLPSNNGYVCKEEYENRKEINFIVLLNVNVGWFSGSVALN